MAGALVAITRQSHCDRSWGHNALFRVCVSFFFSRFWLPLFKLRWRLMQCRRKRWPAALRQQDTNTLNRTFGEVKPNGFLFRPCHAQLAFVLLARQRQHFSSSAICVSFHFTSFISTMAHPIWSNRDKNKNEIRSFGENILAAACLPGAQLQATTASRGPTHPCQMRCLQSSAFSVLRITNALIYYYHY